MNSPAAGRACGQSASSHAWAFALHAWCLGLSGCVIHAHPCRGRNCVQCMGMPTVVTLPKIFKQRILATSDELVQRHRSDRRWCSPKAVQTSATRGLVLNTHRRPSNIAPGAKVCGVMRASHITDFRHVDVKPVAIPQLYHRILLKTLRLVSLPNLKDSSAEKLNGATKANIKPDDPGPRAF